MKERIKELCRLNGISMNKLEDILGFGKGYISKLGESTPNTAKIKKIADYFGVSVDYLLNGEEQQKAKSKPGIKIIHTDGTTRTFDINSVMYSIMKSVMNMPPEQQEMVDNMVGGNVQTKKKHVIYVTNPQNSKRAGQETPSHLPNAAHTRTDIPVTEADIKHDEDIMDGDNF